MGKWLAALEPENPVPPKAPSVRIGSRSDIPEIKKTLSLQDETTIRAWLDHIEETDPDLIAGVLEQCRDDPEARTYFLDRAEEVPTGRYCADCLHFNRIDHPHLGHCAAGEPEPIAGLWDADPRYCRSYASP